MPAVTVSVPVAVEKASLLGGATSTSAMHSEIANIRLAVFLMSLSLLSVGTLCPKEPD
jgi:hypothetical protein